MTGKGQITIPLGLRAKYRLRHGSNFEIFDTANGILLRPKVSTYETSGSTSREASASEIEDLLEKTLAQVS